MAPRYEEIMKTKPYMPFHMGGNLTKAIIARAREELGETEEVKAKTIPQLRRLIEDEPGFFCPTDDAYLLQYLRPRKFNVKRAFSLLKNYYEVKKSNYDLFGRFDREVFKRAYDLKSGFVLPYRDEEGCAVAIIKMEKWDIDVTNASEAITTLCGVMMMAVQEPATQICGLRLLVDVRGANLRQISGLIPRHARLFAKALTNTLPVRFKSVHLFNESALFQCMWSIMKLFATEKIKKRIHLHGDNQKNLHKFIPKDILPAEDYGGDNPNDVALWFNQEVEKYYGTFGELATYGYRQ